jgi:hypothetical protein
MMTLSLFSTLAIGTIPAYLIAKAQKTDRKGQGEIQVAITSDSVREIFKELENGDGAAFFEGVRHQSNRWMSASTAVTVRGL